MPGGQLLARLSNERAFAPGLATVGRLRLGRTGVRRHTFGRDIFFLFAVDVVFRVLFLMSWIDSSAKRVPKTLVTFDRIMESIFDFFSVLILAIVKRIGADAGDTTV